MDEILRRLPAGSLVLDLGSRQGSFAAEAYPVRAVRLDRERVGEPSGLFVQADAAQLPFRPGCFAAVIANHSLEHIEDLDACLREIGRVAGRRAALFAAVPDAATLTDRLYRWLGKGGGHVNAFTSREEIERRIEQAAGLRCAAARTLCTSLSFLNRRNLAAVQRKMILLAGGWEPFLVVLNCLLRWSDRWLGTRLSVYGWALFFGAIEKEPDRRTWVNACVRCGAAHPSEALEAEGAVRRQLLFRTYCCPGCGAMNFFHPDSRFRHLQ